MKEQMKPEDLKAEIKVIRKTRAGDVLLEMGKNLEDREGVRNAINSAIGNTGKTRHLIPKTTIEIRDLDSVTEEDEVRAAITRVLPNSTTEKKITVTKANGRGLRMAIITLNEAEATAILKNTRIKVGYTNCRVRRRIEVLRCWRCLSYGHHTKTCQGPDRHDLCHKCGSKGHKLKDCQEEANCVLCGESDTNSGNTKHVPGSGSCSVFRRALEEQRSKEHG